MEEGKNKGKKTPPMPRRLNRGGMDGIVAAQN
jgi:hypothetical protein